jgi:hypothetical protein
LCFSPALPLARPLQTASRTVRDLPPPIPGLFLLLRTAMSCRIQRSSYLQRLQQIGNGCTSKHGTTTKINRRDSIWVGYNFSVGKKLIFEASAMIGGVFGNTTGVAPGYEVSLSYKRIVLSSSGEYVFDTKNKSGNFLYSWPQLTYHWSGFTWVSWRNAPRPTIRVLTPSAGYSSAFPTRELSSRPIS